MRRSIVAALVAAGLLLAGCGGDDDTVDRDELVKQFTSSGFTQEQAECFADEIGEVTREELEDPSALFDRGAAAGEACLEELGGIDVPEELDGSNETIPDISIPDFSIPEG